MAHCSYEVQRWKAGFYTLMHDDLVNKKSSVGVMLYLNVVDTESLQGGYTSVLADNSDEEVKTNYLHFLNFSFCCA
jgi:hypothetical protein